MLESFLLLKPRDKAQEKRNLWVQKHTSPPQVNQLKPFEDDLLKLIESVKFRPVNTTFQKKLNRDAKRIRNEKNILVPAADNNCLSLHLVCFITSSIYMLSTLSSYSASRDN